SVPDAEFELQMMVADDDWRETRVGFRLEEKDGMTWVRFSHTGWPSQNEHYRVSCHCWAMYLRILRRYLEHGEVVSYEERLDARASPRMRSIARPAEHRYHSTSRTPRSLSYCDRVAAILV